MLVKPFLEVQVDKQNHVPKCPKSVPEMRQRAMLVIGSCSGVAESSAVKVRVRDRDRKTGEVKSGGGSG